MARIFVTEFLTLDGVYQAPGQPDEDTSGGFTQGGWQQKFFDEAEGKVIMDGMAITGAFLLGRRTYDIFAAYWPKQAADDPLAGTMKAMHKHVVSTTLTEPLAWENSRLISSNVPDEVARLREQPGKDIQVIGSGKLLQTLIEHDLVDEYRLLINPIVLGNGRKLFGDGGAPANLRLTNSQATEAGVLILTYEPARG